MLRAAASVIALGVTATAQPSGDSVFFRPPVFSMNAGVIDISGGRETAPWGEHESWTRGYMPCAGDLAVISESTQATNAQLASLGIDGLPIGAEVEEGDEFSVSGISFEALDGGIVFSGDGGFFLDNTPTDCTPPPTHMPTMSPVESSSPTPMPSFSPTTSNPTSSEPTASPATTAPTHSCPANCGVPDRGGGRCRPNQKCLSCNDNRLLSNGACYQQIACKGRRVQTGSRAGEPCRCLNDHCHYCIRTTEGDTCRVCRDGWYLLNDECIESCPASLASSGINLFKRRCEIPHTCQSGRITSFDVAPSYGCKCANEHNNGTASCHICLHRAGEHGQHCIKCNNAKYLHMNRCIDSCDGLTDDNGAALVEYYPGNYGRECRPAFTCTGRQDEAGNPCKCPRAVGKHDCASCDYTTTGAVCQRCTNNKYLSNGGCVNTCPSGTSPVGDSRDGRECVGQE